MRVTAVDGSLDVFESCGGFQGTPEEPERFGVVFQAAIDRWRARLAVHKRNKDILATCPGCGKVVDMALTTYVDDIGFRMRCDTKQEMERDINYADQVLKPGDEPRQKDDHGFHVWNRSERCRRCRVQAEE